MMYTYQEIFSPCSDKLSIWISKEDKWRKKWNINISNWRTVLQKKQLTSRDSKKEQSQDPSAAPRFEHFLSSMPCRISHMILFKPDLVCSPDYSDHSFAYSDQNNHPPFILEPETLVPTSSHRRNAKGKECFNNVWITTKVKLE